MARIYAISFVGQLLCTINTVQRLLWCRVFLSSIDKQPHAFEKTFTQIRGKATELDVQTPDSGVVELLLQEITQFPVMALTSSLT